MCPASLTLYNMCSNVSRVPSALEGLSEKNAVQDEEVEDEDGEEDYMKSCKKKSPTHTFSLCT